MKLILATRNKHKIREIKQILKSPRIAILSMLDFKSAPKVKEDGSTFKQNALKKASAFAEKFSLPAISDDSGLEIKSLKGAPGVRSARFAGPNSTKEKLCRKVLKLMKDVPASGRVARFVCSLAIVLPNGRTKVVEGIVSGRISREMKGANGFGYDPIFIPRGYKKTFAEMKPAMKNRLSHRGRALKKAKDVVKEFVL
jgi:XTP/dITP diphosphohydrolase